MAKEQTKEKSTVMTTQSGRPVGDNQNSVTAGPRGPVLMEDYLLFEKMAQFNRERIPERIVHAKGAAAYGTFTVTQDITRFTSAKVFNTTGSRLYKHNATRAGFVPTPNNGMRKHNRASDGTVWIMALSSRIKPIAFPPINASTFARMPGSLRFVLIRRYKYAMSIFSPTQYRHQGFKG